MPTVSIANLYEHRSKANNIREGYSARVVEIRKNGDLSAEGKRRLLAVEYTKTKRQLSELAKTDAAGLSGRRESLEVKLVGVSGMPGFSGGTHAISARDASDRAAQIKTPSEAADLLRRAEADGDEILARAVTRRALTASGEAPTREAEDAWDDVTRAYLGRRPALEPVVEELAEIERMTQGRMFSPFTVTRPTEITQADLNTVGHRDEVDA